MIFKSIFSPNKNGAFPIERQFQRHVRHVIKLSSGSGTVIRFLKLLSGYGRLYN